MLSHSKWSCLFYFIHNFLSELFRLSEMWDSNSIAVGFRLSFFWLLGWKLTSKFYQTLGLARDEARVITTDWWCKKEAGFGSGRDAIAHTVFLNMDAEACRQVNGAHKPPWKSKERFPWDFKYCQTCHLQREMYTFSGIYLLSKYLKVLTCLLRYSKLAN